MADKVPFPKDPESVNLQDKETSDEEKFNLQKKLGDIAAKKQQEEITMLSRETVRQIRVSGHLILS